MQRACCGCGGINALSTSRQRLLSGLLRLPHDHHPALMYWLVKTYPTHNKPEPMQKKQKGKGLPKEPKPWVLQAKAKKLQMKLSGRPKEITLPSNCSPKVLSNMMGVRTVEILKWMIRMGEKPKSSTELLPIEMAELIAHDFNFITKKKVVENVDVTRRKVADRSKCPSRAAVVTVVGHVDHGKTTLLDRLRKTQVALGEPGGITQHIGAFVVELSTGDKITFMDTPGHAAFSSLRERGVKTTDIALVVIAADDGIQDQTVEAILAAQKARVQLFVCITKIDKLEKGNTQAIRAQLLKHNVVLEEFGGTVQCVEISAKSGKNLDKLEQALVLQAGMMDLRAPIDGSGEAVIIESRKDLGRGVVASALVQAGTLRNSDVFVVGYTWGRIRAMTDHAGQPLKQAGPSIPVEIIGLKGLPEPGAELIVVKDERTAEKIVKYRQAKSDERNLLVEREKLRAKRKAQESGTLEAPDPNIQIVPSILKADAAGSIDGIRAAVKALPSDEVQFQIIRATVGQLTESDLELAKASNSVVITFNVKTPPTVQELARQNHVSVYEHQIVYKLVDQVTELVSSKLAPRIITDVQGVAEIMEVFPIEVQRKKILRVAGCRVLEGTIRKNAKIRVLRDKEKLFEGKLDTLKLFKQNVTEIRKGSECGISLDNFDDFQKGDVLEAFTSRAIPRKLGEKL